MRAILEEAARPKDRLRLGSMLQDIGRKHDLTRADLEAVETVNDRRPSEPMTFE
jgi:hypothetical protein